MLAVPEVDFRAAAWWYGATDFVIVTRTEREFVQILLRQPRQYRDRVPVDAGATAAGFQDVPEIAL